MHEIENITYINLYIKKNTLSLTKLQILITF